MILDHAGGGTGERRIDCHRLRTRFDWVQSQLRHQGVSEKSVMQVQMGDYREGSSQGSPLSSDVACG